MAPRFLARAGLYSTRDFQLVAFIIQNVKPINFCCRKIAGAKTGYTVPEKELLNLVETLK